MYFPRNKKRVVSGETFTWVFQGALGRNVGLEFTLQLMFVETAKGRKGIGLGWATNVPAGLTVTALQPNDMTLHNGNTVWLEGYNGLAIEFEGEKRLLLKPDNIDPGMAGDVYFHFLPTQYSDGNIVFTEDDFLESA